MAGGLLLLLLPPLTLSVENMLGRFWKNIPILLSIEPFEPLLQIKRLINTDVSVLLDI